MDKKIERFKPDIEYCKKHNIKKMLVFIQSSNTLLSLNNYIKENDYDIEVIGVTFPANEVMYQEDAEGRIKEFIPETAKNEGFEKIKAEGITLIRSSLPFEGIVIPNAPYNLYRIIEDTFDLLHIGLANLVQMVMVSTDTGNVYPGEEVIASNLELFIRVKGVNTRMLYHPEYGLKIKDLVSKNKEEANS